MKNFCLFMKKTANRNTPLLVVSILGCGAVNILARYMCGQLYDTIGTERGIFYRNAVIVLCPCLIVLTWLRYDYSQRYLAQVEQDLSRGLEEAVTAMPLRELENSPKGHLLNLRESDIPKVSSFLKRFYERFLNSAVLYLLSLVLLAAIHPSLVLPGAISVYNMIICRTYFMNSIPYEMTEAAYIDGANDIQILTRLILPLSKSVLAVLVLYYAVGHWNTYFNCYIYMSSESKMNLQVVLRNLMATASQLSEIADATVEQAQRAAFINVLKYAVIVCGTVPMVILYPFVQKYFVKGVMIGSIKG